MTLAALWKTISLQHDWPTAFLIPPPKWPSAQVNLSADDGSWAQIASNSPPVTASRLSAAVAEADWCARDCLAGCTVRYLEALFRVPFAIIKDFFSWEKNGIELQDIWRRLFCLLEPSSRGRSSAAISSQLGKSCYLHVCLIKGHTHTHTRS